MALNSMQEILTEEQSMEKMRAAWHAMLESVVSYQGDQRSRSGLVGGDGARMRRYAAADTTYSGPYVQEVIATALSVGESNACMRKIVAAPTAGACGVLPAVLVPLYQMGRATAEHLHKGLLKPFIDFLKFSLKDCSHLCGNTTDNLGQLPLSGQDIIPLAGQIFISLIYTGKLLNGPKIGISQCGDFAPQL